MTNSITCDKCGQSMAEKEGRFGKFLACTGYPDCKNTKPLDNDGQPMPDVPKQNCEKCGQPMAMKNGRYGPFLACTGYPDCRNIKNIEQKTGVNCPQCKQGDIVIKRSKMGKTFYACNKYPNCKFALWQKPTGEKCPDCESLLTFASENKIQCNNKGCKFEKSGE